MNEFTRHNNVLRVPRLLMEPTRRVPTDRPTLDRMADEAIQRELASANEGVRMELTEQDVDEWARTLEKAQRQNPSKPFNPPAGENF